MGNLDDPRMPYDYSKREYGTLPPDDRKTFRWVSEIAYKNVHRIVARGRLHFPGFPPAEQAQHGALADLTRTHDHRIPAEGSLYVGQGFRHCRTLICLCFHYSIPTLPTD